MSILTTHGPRDVPHSAPGSSQLYEVLAAVPVGPALKETPGRSAQDRGSWLRAMLFEGRRGKANA